MNKLGYGLSKLPTKSDNTIDEEKSMNLIEYALKCKINIFDTSPFYMNGQSECIVGMTLKKNKQSQIITKISLKEINDKEDFLRVFNEQLQKLNREYIDYYLIHGFDNNRINKFKDIKINQWLNELKNSGKIKNIGFSFHGKLNLIKEVIKIYNWDVCMVKFSPFEENFEIGYNGINLLKENKIKIFIMQPYFGGIFTDLVKKIDEKKGMFYSIWDNYKMDTIFFGTKSITHLKENIDILNDYYDIDKKEQALKEFNKVKENYISNKTIKCDGCSECICCEKKIAIPYIFIIYNVFKITGNQNKFIHDYENIVKKHGNFRKYL